MKKSFTYFVLTAIISFSGCAASKIDNKSSSNLNFDQDTVQSYQFDTGKMWTLEDAPLDYFEQKYSFKPSEKWMQKVQKSALKFGSWCSASFVSGDGLILTNHHCVDNLISRIEEDGEDIYKNGFYAPTPEDERRVPHLSVDQLLLIEDVTKQIFEVIDTVKDISNLEKIKNNKIAELEREYSEDTDLVCEITSLYNGGKYSLYGYKKYYDIRAVYINESRMGLYGGDPDNFTYPRYNPDFAFFRVYNEEGNPLKTENYFEWDNEGARENEPIFVVGHPGSSFRLKTMAQLEYMRDYSFRNLAFLSRGKTDIYFELMKIDSANAKNYEQKIVYLGNTAKVLNGLLEFLNDEYLMARKLAFEKKFQSAIHSNPKLEKRYGHLWKALESTVNEKREYAGELSAYSITPRSNSQYFIIAKKMIELGRELNLPENERKTAYKEDQLAETIESIFPSEFNQRLEDMTLELNIDYFYLNLGEDDPTLKKISNGLRGKEAADYMKNKSSITSSDKILELARKGGNAILNSNDPFIQFVLRSEGVIASTRAQNKANTETENILENELGRALFEIYGTSIPPDATFTLRISDGELKSYQYNGTIAPTHTTFYGMYDRYYSFSKEYPWDLPERWLHPKEGFEMSTQYNFISTNDVTGGSSGSPVVNSEGQIIGTSFDGNIESIPGDFLYNPIRNRTVNVSSAAILQILRYIGEADRIADELEAGKISD